MFRETVTLKCKGRSKVSVIVFKCGFTVKDSTVIDYPPTRMLNPMYSYMLDAREVLLLSSSDPDSVEMSPDTMYRVFRVVFNKIRQRYSDPDVHELVSSKLSVIDSRINDLRTCLICWEPITSANCIVSTCCFVTYCYECIGEYSKQYTASGDPGMMIPTIAPCCGMFTMLPRYSAMFGHRLPTKCEKLRETLYHFSGANIVVYAPKYNVYKGFVKYVSKNCVRVEDVYEKSPFCPGTSGVLISAKSSMLGGYNWRDVTVFIDLSEVDNPIVDNPELVHVITHAKIYYKFKYSE